MRNPACVGALIRDERNRIFAQRRTSTRRVLPGIWDVVGGHLEGDETPEEALAREITEETGWALRRIEALVADWEWEHEGVVRRELDYLVEVDGDLTAPRLEDGKHDAYAWVGPDNLELMMEGRTDGDRRLRDIVAKGVRTRLTERLRLEPMRSERAHDLWRLHQDPGVAEWFLGTWSEEEARRIAGLYAQAWEDKGVHKWMAYDRESGELVGRGGLSRMDPERDTTRQIRAALQGSDWAEQRLEVGWTVRSSLWGSGYATEIGRGALEFAFRDLEAPEVVAFTEIHNARSRAVMARLGMRYVGEIVHEGAPFVLYTIERSKEGGAS